MTLPIPKIPEYFKDLPDKTLMQSKDIGKILGYKNDNQITNLLLSGKFPVHDVETKSGISHGKHKRIFWYKSTVEKYIKDLNNAGK